MEIDPDSEVWGDWEEVRDGQMDTEENREEYPEGFYWPCCDEKGDSEAHCATGPHKAPPEESTFDKLLLEAQRGLKRKASDIEICGLCHKAFHEDQNHPTACTYHQGMSTRQLCC